MNDVGGRDKPGHDGIGLLERTGQLWDKPGHDDYGMVLAVWTWLAAGAEDGSLFAGEGLVDVDVVFGHAAGGEAGVEGVADGFAGEGREFLDGGDGTGFVFDDEAGDVFVDDFGDGAAIEGDDGGSAGHGFDHDEAEGLGPVDGHEEADGAAEEVGLLGVADFADHLDAAFGQHGLDDAVEVDLVDAVDLGGDLEGDAGGSGDADGAVWAFFRGRCDRGKRGIRV